MRPQVIHEMRAWDAPVLMLPGNHDQVRCFGVGPLRSAAAFERGRFAAGPLTRKPGAPGMGDGRRLRMTAWGEWQQPRACLDPRRHRSAWVQGSTLGACLPAPDRAPGPS